MSDLRKIVGLSSVLAVGFLLVILSCALFKNAFPLILVLPPLLAPIPQYLSQKYSAQHDFLQEEDRNIVDMGRFFFGALLATTVGLPIMFVHLKLCTQTAAWMAFFGGSIIYIVVNFYSRFFSVEQEEF